MSVGRAVTAGRVALVLAGGEPPLASLRDELVAGASLVIAADGGLAHAEALGVSPDLIVGDMDSVSPELLARYAGVERETHPERKDQLDLELALEAAVARGATTLRIVGAFGDRLDQSLAALSIAARYAAAGFDLSLHAGRDEVQLIAAGGSTEAATRPGATVSLLALGEGAVVSFSGVEYPLKGAPLPYGTGLGVSNVALGTSVALAVHGTEDGSTENSIVALILAH